MIDLLREFVKRPRPFSAYTALELWCHPHVSKQMLKAHLDTESDLASRRGSVIDHCVDWIDQTLGLDGKRICDLGCGPGLYTSRFHDRGASVVGLDVSESSLAYATQEAGRSGRSIEYVEADYTKVVLPRAMDAFTLIFHDFCALSKEQRSSLLRKVRESLVPGGYFVLDVHGLGDFEQFRERDLIENRLMDGFWAPDEYVGLMKSFKYSAEKVSLERYLIIEPEGFREIYNWLQYFSPGAIEAEIHGAGFRIEALAGSLKGDPVSEDGHSFGVVARAS